MKYVRLIVVAAIAGSLIACSDNINRTAFYKSYESPVLLEIGRERDVFLNEPIRPLPDPKTLATSPSLVELGNRLYHDRNLSGDGTVSCASCHDLNEGGDDGLQFSRGINNSVGAINAPTVLNAGFNFVQFWNGRAKDLQTQAEGPVANPEEMGANWDDVVAKLKESGEYDEAFKLNFGDAEITRNRITAAIAEFEKILITPSAFDRYLAGDTSAITPKAREGYALFKDLGCVSCHQGINVGGNLYQKFGAIEAYYEIKTNADQGRYLVTGNLEDKAVFKVPSLRNVANTAPYFHNGAAPDLKTAIRIMGVMQLGRSLSNTEIEKLESFLQSLNGESEVKATVASLIEHGETHE